jgi:quercetin dioxygenase-like cupin family protein
MTKTLLRAASLAALLTGTLAFGNAAFAGECPAGKIGVNATPPGPSEPKGVTDTVLATTDLSQEMVALSDHQFRLRRLEIQPGGIVPWHSHGDRPAMIYIVAGEVTEYASNCAVPILHKAGDVAPERHVTAHWWQNNGKEKAVLISVDILHDQTDMNM